MKIETLELLRCPYCGGRLELVESMFHRSSAADEIHDGILGCHCCIFPVIDGIPVFHLQPEAIAARGEMEAGRPERALHVMVGLDGPDQAATFEATIASPTATYKDAVEALGPNFEGGYFLYRFSDPTYVVASAVVRAIASTVLADGGRAVDVCGGSGHLTRILTQLTKQPTILADLYFAKAWLARRFTSPGCEPIVCDANAPLPFARGAFTYAMCSDAFQYVWTKRRFIAEMSRMVNLDRPDAERPGTVVINHTHNQLTWSPSHGQPLPPAGYRDLFEGIEPRIFAEAQLFADVVGGGPLDLSRRDAEPVLDGDPALTLVATRHSKVFAPHAVPAPARAHGQFRLNPLYTVVPEGRLLRLKLAFPNSDYADEYGACLQYLPEETTVEADALRAVEASGDPGPLADLVRRKVIVDLPRHYY